MNADLPVLGFATAGEFENWLAKNHDTARGLWLRMAKKGSGVPSITYAEALNVALCYGWIDGQSKSEDATTWVQRFTPRSKRSVWSKLNRERVAALIEAGRMQPAGLAEIERAKADGRWDAAYDSPKNASEPQDWLAALGKNERAREAYATLDSRNRYAILFRLHGAKRAETRQRRIHRFVDMLARGEKLH